MAKGYCPTCDRLVDIKPDRLIAAGYSARLWRLQDHDDGIIVSAGTILLTQRCDGSGKLI